jgi:tetratricopeptide (TPR) repeat protein
VTAAKLASMIRCPDRRALCAATVALSLAIALPVSAMPDSTTAPPIAEADRHLLRLGDHFYSAGQFYRAIGTYEELSLFTEDDGLRLYGRLRIAMAYQRGEQLEEAVAEYDRILAGFQLDEETGGWLRLQRIIARGDLALRTPQRGGVDAIAAELMPLAARTGAPYGVMAGYHLARLQLQVGDRRAARATVDRARAGCTPAKVPTVPPIAGCALLDRIDRALAAPPARHRSPALGLLLSAAVPGLGSAYSSQYVDGIYYFALTAATGLGAWDVHDGDRSFGDQKTSFYALGTLAAVFYAANVLQGYLSAKRFNAIEALTAQRQRVLDTAVPLPYDTRTPPGLPPDTQ